VGIEIWAVIALITVLSVYLLPLLVGRREMARRSNVQDRYSAELRVLATGDALASDASDEDCDGGEAGAELVGRHPRSSPPLVSSLASAGAEDRETSNAEATMRLTAGAPQASRALAASA